MAAVNQDGPLVILQDHMELRYNEEVEHIRLEEYPMLKDTVYLDHAGITPYAKSLIEQSSRDLAHNLFGNPHSASPSSQLSTRRIEDVRLRALRFFNADPDHFDLVFVPNATAGIKLVAECFRDQNAGFWYGYHRDAHTSLVGAREHAAKHHCFRNDEEVERWMCAGPTAGVGLSNADLGLLAYPAQSNLNGRRLPLTWPGLIRSVDSLIHHRVYTLLDAAALVSTAPLDLGNVSQAPDFTVLSFYKIFGFPDLGALIVRKDSSTPLSRRSYFGGGTVEMASCMDEHWHIKKQNSVHDQLEDGTLPIHSIIALDSAFDVHQRLFVSQQHISAHTSFLARQLFTSLSSLRHRNGSPACILYRDPQASYNRPSTQGPVVALNFLSSSGHWVSNAEVEKLAAIRNIQLRTGGLCNPGGVACFLALASSEMRRNFSAGQRCGNGEDVMGGKPTGIVRLSLGAMSNMKDITTFVRFVEEFFVDRQRRPERGVTAPFAGPSFYIECITVYPIKSCSGWQVPSGMVWDIKSEGLALDREWCLVHQGTRAALSQKRFPRMALLRPTIDLEAGVLYVRFCGHLPPRIPSQVTVPLSTDPLLSSTSMRQSIKACTSSRVCGDSISTYTYTSPHIAAFFTAALSVPCTLARFPPGHFRRHSKLHHQNPPPLQNPSPQGPSIGFTKTALPSIPGAFPPTPPASPDHHQNHPHPILLSNESPVLVISRASLNHLNSLIPNTPAPASVFRANIILAQSGAGSGAEEAPYDEDRWVGLRLRSDDNKTTPTDLDVLGPCRRCQMISIDQTTAERTEEPFVTLAKTRKREGEGGKVFFGVHCALRPPGAGERDGGEGRMTVQMGDMVEPVRRQAEVKR